MTDREIVVHLAEKVMDWKVEMWMERSIAVTGGAMSYHLYSDTRDPPLLPVWDPLTSLVDAFMVQAAIPAPLKAGYLGHLESICVDGRFREQDARHKWAIVTATPRQRSLAAMRATR